MAAAMTALLNSEAHLDRPHNLLHLLSPSSEVLLLPTQSQHTAAIASAKNFLDPLAKSVGEAQELRKRGKNRKRKRSEVQAEASDKVLQLRQVYTEGFGIAQIWEQARRVLDTAHDEVERDLELVDSLEVFARDVGQDPKKHANGGTPLSLDGTGSESSDSEEETDSDGLLESDLDDDSSANVQSQLNEGSAISEDSEQELLHDADSSEQEETPQTYIPHPTGLDDGFFSINDFNKQSQFLEQQDARGDVDERSDEDEIDWDADPLATPPPPQSASKLQEAEHSDSEQGDDNGPTFGDADLDRASDEEDEEDLGLEAGMTGLGNTNDIQYADFFEPPPQRLSKSKRMRALPKTQPPPRDPEPVNESDMDDDIQRAISDVTRDLIDSEGQVSEESDENDAANNHSRAVRSQDKNLSTHEKQVAQLTSEIRRLESAAISKRDWTLSGEARASDRPVNSLIAEDLEFERAGKPVPIITAEVSEEIEGLIKRRILHREFDELVRRRPEAVGAATSTRRGRVEIDDSKSRQGLADVYEVEHLKATDPNYVDNRSAALKKQHAEISRLWQDVSAKLDVLSNLHFKPKRTEVNIQVVNDKPTISMEDARPGGGQAESVIRLAPQEIYAPGEDGKDRREILEKSGLARNKEEMTREEKSRSRRREKTRAKKRRINDGAAAAAEQQGGERKSKKAERLQEKRTILDDLKKGGVKIIGKRGDLENVDGSRGKKDGQDAQLRGTAYKL